jgi:hypothetical protein
MDNQRRTEVTNVWPRDFRESPSTVSWSFFLRSPLSASSKMRDHRCNNEEPWFDSSTVCAAAGNPSQVGGFESGKASKKERSSSSLLSPVREGTHMDSPCVSPSTNLNSEL